MKNKYKNIDDFFASAKNEKPVYNINNIKTMLDKGRFVNTILAIQPNLFKQFFKLKGVKAMSITASIIAGVMALSVLVPNKDAENKTVSLIQNTSAQEIAVNSSNAKEPTIIVENNAVDAINYIDKKSGGDNNNNNLLALNETTETSNKKEKVISILDATVNVSGVNILKLSPSQIEKLGVEVDYSVNSLSVHIFTTNPTKVTLYPNKQQLINDYLFNGGKIDLAPSLITDYKGNRRLMAFEDDGLSMMQLQSTSINLDSLLKYTKVGKDVIQLALSKLNLDSTKMIKLINNTNPSETNVMIVNNAKENEIVTDSSVITVVTKQVVMNSNMNNILVKDMLMDVTEEFSIDLNDIQDKMNKHILINKLIPILVPCPTKEDEDFAFILWYNPTKELLDVLPSKVKNELNREMLKLATTDDYCGVQTGDDSYFDVWRACSGAIKNLNAYPNPCKDKIAINFNLDKSRKITVTLHDLSGSRVAVLDNSIVLNAGEFNLEYNLSDYPAGMYLIVVQDNEGERAVQRIIKN